MLTIMKHICLRSIMSHVCRLSSLRDIIFISIKIELFYYRSVYKLSLVIENVYPRIDSIQKPIIQIEKTDKYTIKSTEKRFQKIVAAKKKSCHKNCFKF